MANTTRTAKTRILAISDTHSHFPSKTSLRSALRDPLPPCDVFIHAGDMTNFGSFDELKKVADWISQIDAQVKIVVAGNHDLGLDAEKHPHGRLSLTATTDDTVALFTSPSAVASGIVYLHDETRTLTLSSGATFTVHGSPWQPAFGDWGFNYPHHLDRWNQTVSPNTAIAADIDILVTHGPPRGVLDTVRSPKDHVGCPWLKLALELVRPRLHVFGHVHESRGLGRIEWFRRDCIEQETVVANVRSQLEAAAIYAAQDLTDEGETRFDCTVDAVFKRNVVEKSFKVLSKADEGALEMDNCLRIDVSETGHMHSFGGPLRHGKETLAVNASLMSAKRRPTNPPIIVDLDLPTVEWD